MSTSVGELDRLTQQLGPGLYTLTVVAVNGAGQRSKPGSLTFTIVGSRR
jgi:predicted phage tail protein